MMEQIRKEEIAKDRWIREHLREIAEDKNDLQENFTPLEVCDMMLDKVDLNSAKSILVLYNIEIVFALRTRNYKGEVTFFTSSLKKCEIAPKFLPGIKVESIEKSKDPLQHLTMAFPDKFDIVIANPPHGSGTKKLDIKFLDKALDICDGEIVFVHPSSQYVDGKGQNKLYNQINEKIKDHLKGLDFFNGNGVFCISMAVPCVITHIDKKSKKDDIELIQRIVSQKKRITKESIKDISIFGHREEFNSIKGKIESYKKGGGLTLKNISTVVGFSGDQSAKMVLENPESFFVQVSHIQGASNIGENSTLSSSVVKENFFILLNEPALVVCSGRNPNYRIWFEFLTEKEAENFIIFAKTDFARMCLSLVKTNKNIAQNELDFIPAMDFTQEWTDEKLYKHFSITEDEQAFIKEIIPPYYDARGTETED